MLRIGQKVNVKGEDGTVRFLGTSQFAAGDWVGIELHKLIGKNDGSLHGVRYFQCEKEGNYGIFVRPSMLNSELEAASRGSSVQTVIEKLQVKLRTAKQDIEELKNKLKQKQDQIDDFDAQSEGLSVDNDFLRTQNQQLLLDLELLQAKYNELQADYEILKEEQALNTELEDAVKKQMESSNQLSSEDYLLLLQHNKKLELALVSVKSMFTEKERSLENEIQSLKQNLLSYTQLQETFKATKEKLDQAQRTIPHLQEQLESVAELDLIVEYLTRENDALNAQNAELKHSVSELQEIHEIDKSIEESLRKVEQDLKAQIDDLVKQIGDEKLKVEKQMAKSKRLEEELVVITEKASKEDDNGRVLSMKHALKGLTLELQNSQFLAQIHQASKDEILAQNLEIIPEKFSTVMAIVVHIRITRSILGVILSWNIDGGIENASITSKLIALESQLGALNHHTHFEYEESTISLTKLGQELSRVQELLISEFQSLRLANSDGLGLLDILIQSFGTYADLAKFTQVVAYYELCQLNSTLLVSVRICQAILASVSQDLKLPLITDLSKICSQSQFTIGEFSKVLHKVTNFSEPELTMLPVIKKYDIPLFNTLLISCHDQLMAHSDASENDKLTIIQESISREDASKYLLFVSQIQTEVNLSKLPMSEHRPFTHFIRTSTLVDDAASQKELKLHDAEKDRIIGDLKLKLELVERNMSTTIDGKSSQIAELQERLRKTRADLEELERKRAESEKASKHLEDQFQTLLELSAQEGHNTIRAFENLKAQKGYTREKALLDEVALLREMITRTKAEKVESYDWLKKPLAPQFQFKKRGQNSFELRARDVKAHAARLLHQILKTTKNAKS